jgi:hypothetical protein
VDLTKVRDAAINRVALCRRRSASRPVRPKWHLPVARAARGVAAHRRSVPHCGHGVLTRVDRLRDPRAVGDPDD